MKKILSETTRPIVLIFGMYMQHYLVDCYQGSINNVPGDKMAPHRGSHVLHSLVLVNMENILVCNYKA